MKAKKLKAAIEAGDLEKVRKLIGGGADVSSAFADGTTPIQLAARQGQVTILRALAAAGADLGDLAILDFQERLKLFVDSSFDASKDDDLITSEELSSWAMEAVGETMDSKTAASIAAMEGDLLRAVRIGDIDLLRERLTAGDDVNQERPVTRDTPLTLAVQAGDEDMVSELLAAGAKIDHVGYSTALSFALPGLQMAKLLIEAGADATVRGLDLRTPLERAVHRALNPGTALDSHLLVRFFLEAGVHPPSMESVEGEMLLEVEHGEAWELFQELLPHYPFDVAKESFEKVEDARRMREQVGGREMWAADLRYAASSGDLDALRATLAKRPEEFAADAGHAVREALREMRLEVTRVLVDAGADLDVFVGYSQARGGSPLAMTAESWHRRSGEAMRMVLEAGASVDLALKDGRTALMYAVTLAYRHGAVLDKAIPALLAAGADPNVEDELGLTAWSLAKAPLIEVEERQRLGLRRPPKGSLRQTADSQTDEVLFDGPDLSELFSDAANRRDRGRDRLERCRKTLELLEAAGAEPHGEDELRMVVAATFGDQDAVSELLAKGARADACGVDGKPALLAAVTGGHREIVARLIAAGCDVDRRVAGQPSAAELAIQRLDLEMTRQLIEGGANVVMLAAFSSGALAAAEAAGADELVAMIRAKLPPQLAHLDHAVVEDKAADDLYWAAVDELPRNAALGDLNKVREALAIEDVEIDGFDPLKRTALLAASEAGQLAMVEELIRCGADVNQCNGVVGCPRSTPLICAAISASARRDETLRVLLEAGADPDKLGADGRTALMHAVERDVGFFGRVGDFALSTRTLITAGADFEIHDPYGLTAWMRALSLASSIDIDDVADQYEAIAGLLEETGADTSRLTEIELIWTVMGGETAKVAELLAVGVTADARRHDGSTALMLAVRDEERDIVRLLLEAGCDVNAYQWLDHGPTAMRAASQADDRVLVRLLEAAGAASEKSR